MLAFGTERREQLRLVETLFDFSGKGTEQEEAYRNGSLQILHRPATPLSMELPQV